ncbi:hypothetical protein V8F33_005233 [Rhypophila sp. PSN 637]
MFPCSPFGKRHGGHSPFWLALILASLLPSAFGADFSQNKDPKGALRVRLDYGLATSWPKDNQPASATKRTYVYSSHLVFKESVDSITDEQLWRITVDAHQEMVRNHKDEFGAPTKFIPGIMSVLAVNNELFITSSQRGQSYTYDYSQTPVKKELELCSLIWGVNTGLSQQRHRNSGSCGEVMAAHQYYLVHNSGKKEDALGNQKGGRTAAVRTTPSDLTKADPTDPCASKNLDEHGNPLPELPDWGCRQFLDMMRLTDIPLEKADNMPERVELNEIAGGVVLIEQVSLCSGGSQAGPSR